MSGRIHIFELATARRIDLEEEDIVVELSFSPDGRTLVSASLSGVIHQWEVATGRLFRTVSPGEARLPAGPTEREDGVEVFFSSLVGFGLAHSVDGTRFVAVGEGFTIFDSATGVVISRSETGERIGEEVAFSNDGRFVFSGSESIQVWDAASGKLRAEVASPPIESLDVSPDGQRIVTGSDEGVISIWDTSRLELLLRIRLGTTGTITSAAFSSDGRRLLIGTSHGEAFILGSKAR
jgi:WD40 repeat protein